MFHHNRNMLHLHYAGAYVASSVPLLEFICTLHQCNYNCEVSCLTKKSAVAITVVVLDTCAAAAEKLKIPITVQQTIECVKMVAEEIWAYYRLDEEHLDWDNNTVKNQVIHLSMYVKVKSAYEELPQFDGWK
jgi:hypothetical protein